MITKKIWLYGFIIMAIITGTYVITSEIYKTGYKSGVDTTKVDYDKRISKLVSDQSLEISRLSLVNSELSSKARASVTEIDNDYILTLEQKNEELQNVLNRVSDGTLRLYDHGDTTPTPSKTGPDNPTSCTSVSNDTSNVGLSKETSRFLVGITAEADRNTEQLAACQNLVRTYLDVIEQYNQSLSQGPSGLPVTGKPD